MNTIFSTIIYKVTKPKKERKEKIFDIFIYPLGISCILLFFVPQILEYPEIVRIIFWIVIVPAIIVFFTTQFLSFFETEEFEKKSIAKLKISTNEILWNEKKIRWSNIEEIDISYHSYKDKYIMESGPRNNWSAGIDNTLKIKVKSGETYYGNFILHNEQQSNDLRELFWQVVKSNDISHKNAVNIIQPGNYQEHQEIKKYCGIPS